MAKKITLTTTKEEIIKVASEDTTNVNGKEIKGGFVNGGYKWQVASESLEGFIELVEKDLGFKVVKVLSEGREIPVVRVEEGITISSNGFVTVGRWKDDVDEEAEAEEVVELKNVKGDWVIAEKATINGKGYILLKEINTINSRWRILTDENLNILMPDKWESIEEAVEDYEEFMERYMKEKELIAGRFVEGETVTVRLNGRKIERKVRWDDQTKDLYVTDNGARYWASEF